MVFFLAYLVVDPCHKNEKAPVTEDGSNKRERRCLHPFPLGIGLNQCDGLTELLILSIS